MATMPQATAPVRHVPVRGRAPRRDRSARRLSNRIVTMWTARKTTAAPPRKRCRSSSQAGRGRPRSTRVLSARPQSTLAARSAHVTMPAARAVYQRSVVCICTKASPAGPCVVWAHPVKILGGAGPGAFGSFSQPIARLSADAVVHGPNSPAAHASPGPALAHRRRGRKRARHSGDRGASGRGRNPDARRRRDEPLAGAAVGGERLPRIHIDILTIHIDIHVHRGGDDGRGPGGAGARADHLERWQLSAASGRWGRGRT